MAKVLEAESVATPARRRWASGRRRAISIVAALLLLGSATAVIDVVVGSDSPPSLIPVLSDRPDPSQGISGGLLPMEADVAIELGTFPCATRHVTLTSVSLYRPSPGIRLVRWRIENTVITEDGEAASLARLGPFTPHDITQVCGASPNSRMGLQLHRTQPGTQSFLGLRITYRSDGRQKVAYLWEQYQLRQAAGTQTLRTTAFIVSTVHYRRHERRGLCAAASVTPQGTAVVAQSAEPPGQRSRWRP